MRKTILVFVYIFISTLIYAQNETAKIKVQGLCGMCTSRIQNTALKAGAETAEWDIKTKVLKLTYNPKTVKYRKKKKRVARDIHKPKR